MKPSIQNGVSILMKQLISRFCAAFLAILLAVSALACGGKTAEPSRPAEEQAPAAEQAPIASEDAEALPQVPDNGTPDRSGYPYLDAIAAYKKTDWSANWIWTKGCSEDSYVAFRKTFTLDQPLDDAYAFISAVDKYELWVNGVLVVLDGSVKRGATPFDSYYDTVHIPGLIAGENTVALLVAFNGRSGDGSIVPLLADKNGDEFPQAGLLFELHAGDTVIPSDNTWKALRHTGYKNALTAGKAYTRYKQFTALAENNVHYDAADSIGAFWENSYDDSSWENANLIGKAGDLPFGDLYDALIPVPSFGDQVDFLNASDWTGKTLSEDTTISLDLPGNIQFTWTIELTSEAGKRLTIYTNTYEDRQGLTNFKDTYITAAGEQTYENFPWRSGSKLIIEAEAGVTFTRLAYRPSGYAGKLVGAFTSSDPALDQLFSECANTIAICVRDTFMDCPDRERGPYMGDASNQIDSSLYSYDGTIFPLIKKAILACVAWTPESNAIPSRAPSVKPSEIPNQVLAFFTSAYHYWMHSGDKETMTAYYRAFIPYLKLYELDGNGLPKYRDGSWTWNDWGEKIDIELLQVGFYAYALRLAIQLAEDLDIHDDDAFLSDRMSSLQQNWRNAYTTDEGFRSASSKYVDDRANAMLVLSGLAEESDYEQISNVLASTYEASPFTEKYILDALGSMGRTELVVKRMTERYSPMLSDEWDTLWEQFNDVTGTRNHAWTAAPQYILAKYVAGIRPVAPGWASYEIVPYPDMESYSCSVWTPNGMITVEKNGTSLTVNAPAGGTLVLPGGQAHTIESAGVYTFEMGN